MDFLELAEERFSVRKFTEEKIEQEKIDKLLRAAQVAPTAKNLQPQRILMLHSKEALDKLKRVTKCSFGCTLAFIVCYDESIAWTRQFDNKSSGDIDASIVATHIMLEAQSLGLGSTWVMYFEPEKLKKEFNLPENIKPTAILVMGYPASDAPVSPLHNEMLDINEFMVGESF